VAEEGGQSGDAIAVSPAPTFVAMNIASQPLAASPIRVSAAAALLPLRSTLVAPGLPEPKLRGSARRKARETITAKGTEPSR
jgi:hypothetical protein